MHHRIKSLWSNVYIQGGFILTVSSFLVNFLNYIFNFIAGRILGPVGYGEITSLFSYITLCSFPIAIISTFIIQKISSHDKDPYLYTHQLESSFWMLLKKWSWIGILLLCAIPFIPRITNLSPIVAYTLIPLVLIGFITAFYTSAFQGLKLFLLYAFIGLIGGGLKLISILPGLFETNSLPIIVILQLFFNFLLLIAMVFILRKYMSKQNSLSYSTNTKSLFHIVTNKYFIMTCASVLGITLLTTIDMIFVKKFFSSTDSGIYNSWNLFSKMILYVLGPIAQVSFVFFSDNSQKHLQEKVLKLSIILLIFVGLVSYFSYTTIGLFLIQILFGTKFNALLPFLSFASLFGTFYAAITFFNSYFLAKKHKGAFVTILCIPFYITALFLIPKQIIFVMYTNIIFCLILTIIYSSFFIFKKNNS
ncbi:MAG: oligosaccharide flippase family protein [bacterium]|nr:oligosaccharide flippase family protein [bacterium]